MTVRKLLIGSAFFLGTACVTTGEALPPSTVEIAGGRAVYRDYRDNPNRICNAEHRWLLDELVAVNSVLRRFTEGVGSGDLGYRQRQLLEEGARTLPEVLKAHEVSLNAVERCEFASRGGFETAVSAGRERIAEVRQLLDEAPQRIARAEAVEQLKAWRRELPRMQLEAKAGCDRRNPRRIYFAWEQENGTRNFAFCDGASVTQRDGDTPLWLPPEGAPTRGRYAPKEKNYLEAVEAYSVELISRPPTVPEVTASAKSGS